MAEQTVGFQETRPNSATINFEPAEHPVDTKQTTALMGEYWQGNLQVHIWNSAVTQRIREYGYAAKSLYLAIDGLSPSPVTRYPIDALQYRNMLTWLQIPSNPAELNTNKSIYVIKGDTYEVYMPQVVLADQTQIPDKIIHMGMDNLTAHLADNSEVKSEALARAGLYLTIMAGADLISKNSEIKRLLASRISRRSFLKLGAVFAGALALEIGSNYVDFGTNHAAAFANTEKAKDIWRIVSEVEGPKFFSGSWTNGRTGVLLAKSEDVRDRQKLGADSAMAVVMGFGHQDTELQLELDKVHRASAIKNYAQDIIAFGKKIYSAYYGVNQDAISAQAVNGLLDFIALTEIEKVTDPGTPQSPADAQNRISKCIQLVDSFLSPQVLAATKDLRA